MKRVRFADRIEAGRLLADRLQHLKGQPVLVLGLPRGGVPVAREVAAALQAPLDVIVVRKLGVPSQPELGMGAIGEGGTTLINPMIVEMTGLTDHDIAKVEEQERIELERRVRRYRGNSPSRDLEGSTAVVVDDGVATGFTAMAACEIARARGAERIVLAVPVAPVGSAERFGDEVDEFVCLASPPGFQSIGQFYGDFSPTSDEEVVECLLVNEWLSDDAPAAPTGDASPEDVVIPIGHIGLPGRLTMPSNARGIVLFAHGSGSSHTSPRNRLVASVLHTSGFGTLLFDLLTPDEAEDRANVFDVDLLGRRLADATAWVRRRPNVGGMPIGYFGASTGAAAALEAAAAPDADIAAVVSRGGRPDLTTTDLAAVRTPTRFIVGGADLIVTDINRIARSKMLCDSDLVVIRGAGHLFSEPGALELVAESARDWFDAHIVMAKPIQPMKAAAIGVGSEAFRGLEPDDDMSPAAFVTAQREEAEGTEIFEDPDTGLKVFLKDGAPGQESIVADLDLTDEESQSGAPA